MAQARQLPADYIDSGPTARSAAPACARDLGLERENRLRLASVESLLSLAADLRGALHEVDVIEIIVTSVESELSAIAAKYLVRSASVIRLALLRAWPVSTPPCLSPWARLKS